MGFDIGSIQPRFLLVSSRATAAHMLGAHCPGQSNATVSPSEELLTDKPHLGRINRFETSVFVPFTRSTGIYHPQ
jgi:hypothetical protein